MNNLSKHETVWLQAYCAAITSVRDYPTVEASDAVKYFKEYFPTEPTPQKESAGAKKETYESQFAPVLKQERKEYWLFKGPHMSDCKDMHVWDSLPFYAPDDAIHVTEIRDGDVVVTREDLAKAWFKFGLNNSDVVFKHFAEALGLR
jgi:hypothetical protein